MLISAGLTSIGSSSRLAAWALWSTVSTWELQHNQSKKMSAPPQGDVMSRTASRRQRWTMFGFKPCEMAIPESDAPGCIRACRICALKVALCLRRAGGCSGVSDSIIVPTKISGAHPTLVSTAHDAMAGRLRTSCGTSATLELLQW